MKKIKTCGVGLLGFMTLLGVSKSALADDCVTNVTAPTTAVPYYAPYAPQPVAVAGQHFLQEQREAEERRLLALRRVEELRRQAELREAQRRAELREAFRQAQWRESRRQYELRQARRQARFERLQHERFGHVAHPYFRGR